MGNYVIFSMHGLIRTWLVFFYHILLFWASGKLLILLHNKDETTSLYSDRISD